jgi:hypothetical protein
MNDDELYEVAIKNVPFEQAKGLYRFLVDLYDYEKIPGRPGLCWSGSIQGRHKNDQSRTVNLRPMQQVMDDLTRLRERTDSELVEQRNRAVVAERALSAIRAELSNGATTNWEYIEHRFEEVLD